jgi:hypothetical protein
MQRSFSSWGVTALGLALAAGGVYAMSTGWDMILLERGWSLFIAGSVAVSGGIVTVALGAVIGQIARLSSKMTVAAAQDATLAPASGLSEPDLQPTTESYGDDPAARFGEEPDLVSERMDVASNGDASAETQPSEVDRYTAAGATYVMMSDGSVEVHSASGTQRYPSLAALRANAQAHQR